MIIVVNSALVAADLLAFTDKANSFEQEHAESAELFSPCPPFAPVRKLFIGVHPRGTVKAGVADNGNEPLLHGKRPGGTGSRLTAARIPPQGFPGETAATCGEKTGICDCAVTPQPFPG